VLLAITTTHAPATDLGYLLHKHPGKAQSYDLPFGKAHVFYPEATAERCTAALTLDVDPVGLVRGRRRSQGDADVQYVSDRPYVASSFLSTAIAQVFGSALNGRSNERADLVSVPIPLQARIAVVPCRGGEGFLRRLFEPLGYRVVAQRHMLDERFPAWGDSVYYTVDLEGQVRLQDLLAHLYVLVPVLDDDKHYWVGADEVEKLLRRGEGWLATHPERAAISDRYLARQRRLTREALMRLLGEDSTDPDAEAQTHATEEDAVERPMRLGDARLAAVAAALDETGAVRVVDLGCGEGRLLQALRENSRYERIVGVDVSYRSLERARERLHLDRGGSPEIGRVELIHGSLTYRDRRLEGFDAAAAVEVVEHLDAERLRAFSRVVFECARPGTVVLTTPNVEYNVRFSDLPGGRLRHRDHRFEWTRNEFHGWAEGVAREFGYAVRFAPIGTEDPQLGPPTQMGVFTRQ
jgi:3' terminal RNA ribose 2'-O-methyltransferase Hen1